MFVHCIVRESINCTLKIDCIYFVFCLLFSKLDFCHFYTCIQHFRCDLQSGFWTCWQLLLFCLWRLSGDDMISALTIKHDPSRHRVRIGRYTVMQSSTQHLKELGVLLPSILLFLLFLPIQDDQCPPLWATRAQLQPSLRAALLALLFTLTWALWVLL